MTGDESQVDAIAGLGEVVDEVEGNRAAGARARHEDALLPETTDRRMASMEALVFTSSIARHVHSIVASRS